MDADLIEWCRMTAPAVAVSFSSFLRAANTSLRLQSSANPKPLMISWIEVN